MSRPWFQLSIGMILCGAGAWGTARAVDHAWPFWTLGGWPAATAEVVSAIPDQGLAWREGEAQFRLRVRYQPPGSLPVEAFTGDTISQSRLAILRDAARPVAAAPATALIYYDPESTGQVRLGQVGRQGALTYAITLSALGLLAAAVAAFGLHRLLAAAISLAGSRPSGRTAPDSR